MLKSPELSSFEVNYLNTCDSNHISINLTLDTCVVALYNHLWGVDNDDQLDSLNDTFIEITFSDFENNDLDNILKLNYALANHGYTISVDENTVIEDPIEVLFLNTVENGFVQYRNLLNIGKNSQVKFVEKIQNVIQFTLKTYNLNMPQLAIPLRLALLGKPKSPAIDKVLLLLGKDAVFERIKLSLEK